MKLPSVLLLALAASASALRSHRSRRAAAVGASKSGVECNQAAIAECLEDTGLDHFTCLARECEGWKGDEIELKFTKRNSFSLPTCTEEALNDCVQTEDPDVCFDQLCLQ